jgi:2-iminobutanoate/2-iminopropanoate deaminase
MPSPNPYSYAIKTGDTVFLAGLVSRNGRDNSVVQGDMSVQAHAVFENAAAILEAAGLSFADVVSSRVYITDPTAFQAMNEVYRKYFPKDPPARATVIAPLMGPSYVVEITMVAVKGGTRRVVTAPTADGSAPRPNPNLSSAIDVGRRIHVSGMLGVTDANRTDMGGQTRETLAAIGRTLAAAGYSASGVVDAVVYVTDLAAVPEMNAAWRDAFGADVPARATVRTGLVVPDGLVEIMVVAVK